MGIYIYIFFFSNILLKVGFPGGSTGKEYTCSAGDAHSISAWGRSPGEGNVHPLQCSCLGNPMDRGAWQATVHGVAESGTGLKGPSTKHRVSLKG